MFIEEDLQSYRKKLEEDVEETTSERFRKLKRLKRKSQRLERFLKEYYRDELSDIIEFREDLVSEIKELREEAE